MDNTLDSFLKGSNETQKMMKIAFGSNSALLQFAEIQNSWKEKFNVLNFFNSEKRLDLLINSNWSKNFQNDNLKNIEAALYPLKNLHSITDSLSKQASKQVLLPILKFY